jgi:hypothetical protein
LRPKCKSYEIIKKAEKEEKKRGKNVKRATGQPFQPSAKMTRGPVTIPNWYHSFSSLSH